MKKVFLLCLILFASSCAEQKNYVITKSQALDIAKKEFAISNHGDIHDYDISIDENIRLHNWWISFDRNVKPSRFGQDFKICVNAKTGKALVMTGE